MERFSCDARGRTRLSRDARLQRRFLGKNGENEGKFQQHRSKRKGEQDAAHEQRTPTGERVRRASVRISGRRMGKGLDRRKGRIYYRKKNGDQKQLIIIAGLGNVQKESTPRGKHIVVKAGPRGDPEGATVFSEREQLCKRPSAVTSGNVEGGTPKPGPIALKGGTHRAVIRGKPERHAVGVREI